jgi:hypothetical protein
MRILASSAVFTTAPHECDARRPDFQLLETNFPPRSSRFGRSGPVNDGRV